MQAADVPARAQEQPHSEPVDSQCTTEAADSQVILGGRAVVESLSKSTMLLKHLLFFFLANSYLLVLKEVG